jgi:hypothetical protein
MTLWQAVQTQWRAAGFGLIGLDYAEVRRWAEELDIVMTPGLWSKIRQLEYYELGRQGRDADGATQGREADCHHAEKGP